MSMQKFPHATIDSPKSVKEAEARADREDREAARRANGLPAMPIPTGSSATDGPRLANRPMSAGISIRFLVSMRRSFVDCRSKLDLAR